MRPFPKFVFPKLAAALLAVSAFSGLAAEPAFATSYVAPGVTFVNADGTTVKNVYTVPGTSNGMRVYGVYCSNNGSSNSYAMFGITSGGTNSQLWSNSFAVNTFGGNLTNTMFSTTYGNATYPLNLPTDEGGNSYLPVSAGDTITLNMTAAVTSGYTVACRVIGAVM